MKTMKREMQTMKNRMEHVGTAVVSFKSFQARVEEETSDVLKSKLRAENEVIEPAVKFIQTEEQLEHEMATLEKVVKYLK